MGGPSPALGLFFQVEANQVPCILCSIIPVGDNWIVQCGTADHGLFTSQKLEDFGFSDALRWLRRRLEVAKLAV
jgi:hypothetical protein